MKDTKIISRDKSEWTLLAIALADGKPLSPVQLQKAVFLLGERIVKTNNAVDFYDFRPDNYGPFDGQIYDDAREYESQGLVRIFTRAGSKYQEYQATPKGIEAAASVVAELGTDAQRARAIVNWVLRQSFVSLVRAIYEEFPTYKVNSIFRS